MSVEAFTWALTVPVGGNAKVVLLGLANHAHPDGSEAYPALDTLAVYAHCDRSTARRNVRKLHEDGWIEEDGLGPKGQTKWRLRMDRAPAPAPRGGKTPPVASEPSGGGTGDAGGVAPTPPEPSLGTVPRTVRGEDAREHPPEGFPGELRPHAREVYRVLVAVAEQHNARKVWPLAVGRVIMAHPRHPLVASAHALAAWATDPPRPIKDVVGTYRTFLARERELAGPERLAADGAPTSGGGLPEGVTSLHGRRSDPNSEILLRMEANRQRRRLASDADDASMNT